MDLIQIIILAFVQGITEFLPISSSAHLILVPIITGWPDQGLAFDVAVHIGTLSAVIIYFRNQLKVLAVDWSMSIVKKQETGESRLAWGIIIAILPVILAGLELHTAVETTLRSPLVIAITTVVFGILLLIAQRTGSQSRTEHQLSLFSMFLIGVMQAIALIPGTSRSGITMTAGLMLGLTQTAAARFSFLLSIPTIMASGGYKTLELVQSDMIVDWFTLGLGALISGVFAYICIYYFLKMIERIGMMPFVIYRLLLGGVLFYIFA